MTKAPLHPRDCISKKVTTIHRLTANVFRRHLRPHGLTTSQLSILFVVKGTGGIRQKALGVALEMEKSSVTRSVGRLLDQRLVRTDDGVLSLTPLGTQLVQEVVPAWRAAMKEIRGYLGSDGVAAVDIALSKLRNRLDSDRC